MLTKIDAQHGSCRLSFVWGQIRTAAWEASPQIALRDRSKGAVGRSIYKILVKEEFKAIRCLLYKRFSASPQEVMSS